MKNSWGKMGAFALGMALVATLSLPRSVFAALPGCNQANLQAVAPANTTIDSATSVAAVVGPPPIPAHCDVKGHYTDSLASTTGSPNNINFELALPDSASWNGKFLFIGNGGFAGSIQATLTDGFPYATAATDTGHSANELDGSWALNDQLKQDDFGFRSVHLTAGATQTLTHSYLRHRA